MNIVTENGTVLTLEQIQQGIMGVTDSEELKLFGRPMPSLTDMNHPLVVANRVPGKEKTESFGREIFKDTKDTKYVNSWDVMGHEVIVCRDNEGLFAVRMPHAHWRLKNLMQSSVLRFGAVTWKAEVKAMQRLACYVSDPQYTTYVLNGNFIETSKRSGIKYLFRKGAPTLALKPDGEESMKCIAALCLHPLGYYEGTSAGCMTPSDEVIAHLVMMRGDEHFFWRKANQHRSWDARSGV